MDILIGITTADGVIIATSKAFARGVSTISQNDDKTRVLSSHALMGFSGEAGDAVNYAEYIQANVKLYSFRHDNQLSPKAIANFSRNELAKALRSRKPYQVNVLIGGYDTKAKKPVLNWIDYLAANVEVPYAAHGYAAYYILATLDRHHRSDLTEQEGLDLLKQCVKELRTRLPIDFKGIRVSFDDYVI